jgi:hypothetical protein
LLGDLHTLYLVVGILCKVTVIDKGKETTIPLIVNAKDNREVSVKDLE